MRLLAWLGGIVLVAAGGWVLLVDAVDGASQAGRLRGTVLVVGGIVLSLMGVVLRRRS